MSAPSRRPEIRRRRTRKEKILKLRKKLAKVAKESFGVSVLYGLKL